jgi:hypothetical protein
MAATIDMGAKTQPMSKLQPAAITAGADRDRARRTYAPPALQFYGDLRSVTLGPTPGNSESGNPLIFRVKTG